MSEDTWKSSYGFSYQRAAEIMQDVMDELDIKYAHSSDSDAEYFDVDKGLFTIKLYHERFRTRIGFGFPGWLKPGDISDIMVSPIEKEAEPRIRAILKKFVEKSPREPWDLGLKVKAYRIGIGRSVKGKWKRWLEGS